MLARRDTRIAPRTNWLSSSFCYRSLPRSRAFISPKQFSRCPFLGPGSILIFGANTAATTITVDLSLALVIKVPRCSKLVQEVGSPSGTTLYPSPASFVPTCCSQNRHSEAAEIRWKVLVALKRAVACFNISSIVLILQVST